MSSMYPIDRHCDESSEAFGELRQKCCNLENTIKEKDRIIKAFEEKTTEFMTVLSAFQQQHNQIVDEFTLLRSKYDDQKATLVKLLWEVLPSTNPDLNSIPCLDTSIDENRDQIQSYKILEVIGEGQFAQVKKCVSASGHEYAIKMIKKDKVTSLKSIQRISNEVSVMKSIRHDGIIVLFDVFHSKNYLSLVLEYCGYDLFSYFEAHGDVLDEEELRAVAIGILEPLLHLHSNGICHRDLKPENILLCTTGAANHKTSNSSHREWNCVKICDFGLCQVIQSPRHGLKKQLDDFCGSPGFFAPEMILDSSYDGFKSDIWSLGCILLELTIGHEKFCDLWMGGYDYDNIVNKSSFKVEIERSVQELPEYLESDDMSISHNFIDFLKSMLQMKPNLRPTAAGLMQHPWLGSSSSSSSGLSCVTHGLLPLNLGPPSQTLSPGLVILTDGDSDDYSNDGTRLGLVTSPTLKYSPHPPPATYAASLASSSVEGRSKLISSSSRKASNKVSFGSSKSSDDLVGADDLTTLDRVTNSSVSNSKSPIRPFVSQRQRNAFEGQASHLHNRESVKFPPLEPSTPGLQLSRKKHQADDF